MIVTCMVYFAYISLFVLMVRHRSIHQSHRSDLMGIYIYESKCERTLRANLFVLDFGA